MYLRLRTQARHTFAPTLRYFSNGLPDHDQLVLPSLSPTMETGVIARWNVKEGEFIEAGSIICEVETDKATVDYESTDDGWLAKILKGTDSGAMAVGTVIGITVEDEEDIAAFGDYSISEAVENPPTPSHEAPPTPIANNSSVASTTEVPKKIQVPQPSVAVDPIWKKNLMSTPIGTILAQQQREYIEEYGDCGTEPLDYNV